MTLRALAPLALATALVAAFASPASAAIADKTGRFNGTEVRYKVLTPPGYDPAKAYPTILVFGGGGQTLEGAQRTLESDWQAEAEKRGYVVISPAAPDGDLFYEKGARIFPAFLDAIGRDYRVQGKLHVAGHSNGGLSAYYVASHYPSYFSTVTGYPGLLDVEDEEGLKTLKPLCLYMHVGDQDPFWWAAMDDQASTLRSMGDRIQITVEKGQGHRLQAKAIDLSRRLFDEIESCR